MTPEQIKEFVSLHEPMTEPKFVIWTDGEVTKFTGEIRERLVEYSLQGELIDSIEMPAKSSLTHNGYIVVSAVNVERAISLLRGPCPYANLWVSNNGRHIPTLSPRPGATSMEAANP